MPQKTDIETILGHVKALEDVNQDLIVNLMKRIVLVEGTNDLLVKALKSSIGLLKEFKNAVPDPEKWQNLVGPPREGPEDGQPSRVRKCSI